MVNQTLPQILSLLAANDGEWLGTWDLFNLIHADASTVRHSLVLAQKKGMIKRQKSTGGRGHKSLYILTAKGRKELSNV